VKLRWTPEAICDRESIYDYIQADDPSAALALDDKFSELARHLVVYPQIGRPGRVEGTREFVVHKSYILVYDLSKDSIRVLRVLHTSRQWPPFQAGGPGTAHSKP